MSCKTPHTQKRINLNGIKGKLVEGLSSTRQCGGVLCGDIYI